MSYSSGPSTVSCMYQCRIIPGHDTPNPYMVNRAKKTVCVTRLASAAKCSTSSKHTSPQTPSSSRCSIGVSPVYHTVL